ncbi:MAG: hypothetical protein ACT4UQ_06120 [Gammaproteobacteria bacterium]
MTNESNATPEIQSVTCELDSLALEAVADAVQSSSKPAIGVNKDLFNESERRFIAGSVRWLRSCANAEWVLEEIGALLWPEAAASRWHVPVAAAPAPANGSDSEAHSASNESESRGDQPRVDN